MLMVMRPWVWTRLMSSGSIQRKWATHWLRKSDCVRRQRPQEGSWKRLKNSREIVRETGKVSGVGRKWVGDWIRVEVRKDFYNLKIYLQRSIKPIPASVCSRWETFPISIHTWNLESIFISSKNNSLGVTSLKQRLSARGVRSWSRQL